MSAEGSEYSIHEVWSSVVTSVKTSVVGIRRKRSLTLLRAERHGVLVDDPPSFQSSIKARTDWVSALGSGQGGPPRNSDWSLILDLSLYKVLQAMMDSYQHFNTYISAMRYRTR